MRIPEIADRLRELSRTHDDPELALLADELRRRSPVKRADPISIRATPEVRDAIRAFARAHPDLSQVEIAERFNVNPGRVSEALRGFRH